MHTVHPCFKRSLGRNSHPVNILLLAALAALPSCKTTHPATAVKASTAASDQGEIYNPDSVLATTLADPQYQTRVDQLRAMSVGDFAARFAAELGTGTVTVGSQTVTAGAGDVAAEKAYWQQNAVAFKTMGDYLNDAGINLKKATLDEVITAWEETAVFATGDLGAVAAVGDADQAPEGASSAKGLALVGASLAIPTCSGAARCTQLRRSGPARTPIGELNRIIDVAQFYQKLAKGSTVERVVLMADRQNLETVVERKRLLTAAFALAELVKGEDSQFEAQIKQGRLVLAVAETGVDALKFFDVVKAGTIAAFIRLGESPMSDAQRDSRDAATPGQGEEGQSSTDAERPRATESTRGR